MRHTFLLLFLALFCISGCSRSTPLSVENRSGVLLQSVVVSGSGFTEELGDIQPGATATVDVRPIGESNLAIAFTASGNRVSPPADTYFEGGGRYYVAVAVTPSLEAAVDSQLRPY